MTSGKRSKARTWVLGGAALLIATAVAMILWRNAGRRFSGQPANRPPSRSIAGTASADEPGAARSQARAAVEAGRFDQAFELYRTFEGGRWEADDCFALGSALVRRDRIVLGWGAFEAAHRIDPKHTETLWALEEIHGKLALATDAGVYTARESEGARTTWRHLGSGLPNVAVDDLTSGPDGYIYAATHGRGVWRIKF